MSTKKPRKPQERTAVTRKSILTAAERVFAQVGYENAQVDEIAVAAGFSKGGVYAHFKSKEDLFLALYQVKTVGYQNKLRHALESVSSRKKKVDAFRKFYINLAKDKEWALIILEVKLFVRRHPEVRKKIRQIDGNFSDSVEGALCRLFGSSSRAAGEALGGFFSALVLEADLEPGVISERKMQEMLGTAFDALLGI